MMTRGYRKSVNIGHGQTNLPRAMQLSPVPGLSPVDLPLSAQIEKTAAIQKLRWHECVQPKEGLRSPLQLRERRRFWVA